MTHSFSRRSFCGLISASAIAVAGARASDLVSPSQKPILTISGRIGVHNDGDAALFDMPMIESLGMQGFSTATPWYKEVTRFDGVRMSTLLRTVKASGNTVTAIALNDYETEIPISDFEQFEVLLAVRRDGAYMPIRDKGPLFIVYPFDSDVRLQNKRYYSRSAWQLRQLVVH